MRSSRKRSTNDIPKVFWIKTQFGFEDQSKDFKLNAVRERKPVYPNVSLCITILRNGGNKFNLSKSRYSLQDRPMSLCRRIFLNLTKRVLFVLWNLVVSVNCMVS